MFGSHWGYICRPISKFCLVGHAQVLSRVWLFATPWTVAHQTQTLSTGFPRQVAISCSRVEGHMKRLNTCYVLTAGSDARVIKDHGKWDKQEPPSEQLFVEDGLETRDLFSRMPHSPEILTPWELPLGCWGAGRQRATEGLGLWRPQKNQQPQQRVTGPGPAAALKPAPGARAPLAPAAPWARVRVSRQPCLHPISKSSLQLWGQATLMGTGEVTRLLITEPLTLTFSLLVELNALHVFQTPHIGKAEYLTAFHAVIKKRTLPSCCAVLCCAKLLRRVHLFVTPGTTAHRAPLSPDL